MSTRQYPATHALIARLAIAAAASSVVASAALAAGTAASDGYRFVGGEIGYVYEGSTAAGQSARGQRQGADGLRAGPISGDGYRFVGGEAGYVYVGTTAPGLGSGTGARIGLSRAQVQQELMNFQRTPVSADGQWRYVGGEQGWTRR